MKHTYFFILSIFTFLSCSQVTEEEKQIHNQKVNSGIISKKEKLERQLEQFESAQKMLIKEKAEVAEWKLGRTEKEKHDQLAELDNNLDMARTYIENTKQVIKQLDSLHQTFEWQKTPSGVAEKLIEVFQNGKFSKAIYLADPYHENDTDIDRISFIAINPKDIASKEAEIFKQSRIISDPVISGDHATIELLYGINGNRKEDLKLIKRLDHWYLFSI